MENTSGNCNLVTQYSVSFSFTPEHALRDAQKLFHDIDEKKENWRDLIHLESDGWIVGPRGRLLLWVPMAFRPFLRFVRNTLVIPKSDVDLDLSVMAHGNGWEECFRE